MFLFYILIYFSLSCGSFWETIKPFLLLKFQPKHRVPGFTMIRWGFCIPKDCSNEDLENIIHEKIGLKSKVHENMCQRALKNTEEVSTGKQITQKLFLAIIVMTMLATLLDIVDKRQNNCKSNNNNSILCDKSGG